MIRKYLFLRHLKSNNLKKTLIVRHLSFLIIIQHYFEPVDLFFSIFIVMYYKRLLYKIILTKKITSYLGYRYSLLYTLVLPLSQ